MPGYYCDGHAIEALRKNPPSGCKLSDLFQYLRVKSEMNGKRILLGVTRYKWRNRCLQVGWTWFDDLRKTLAPRCRVVMSQRRHWPLSPRLTFQADFRKPGPHSACSTKNAEAGMGHIELARWADQVLVAPATANFMARLVAWYGKRPALDYAVPGQLQHRLVQLRRR